MLHIGDAVLDTLRGRPEELSVVRTMGRVMDYLGQVAEAWGDYERAGVYYIGSGEAYRKIGLRYGFARARRQYGRVRLRQGNPVRAAAMLHESVMLFRAIGDRRAEGVSLLLKGDAHRNAGADADARWCWREALAALVETGSPEAAEARSRLTEAASGEASESSLIELAYEFLTEAGFKVVVNSDEPALCSPMPRSSWLRQFPDPLALVFQFDAPLNGKRVRALCEQSSRMLARSRSATILAVVDRAPTIDGWFQIQTYRAEDTRFVVIDDRVIAEGRASGNQQDLLRTLLQEFLSDPDLYDQHDPVSDTVGFFGRGTLTSRLTEASVAGQPALLVGPRKIGKTSVLRAVHDRLLCPVALIDLQAAEPLPQLLDRIWTDWCRSAPVKAPGLPWPEQRLQPQQEDPAAFLVATSQLLSHLDRHGHDARLALLLDEADILFPRGDRHAERYLALARLLRRLVQEQSRRVALVLACVDPGLNRTGRVAHEQNPFYQFFTESYVSALGSRDCSEMIESLGTRMGLRYEDSSLQFAFEASGGHPFIARQLCSSAYRLLPPGVSQISLSHLQRTAELFIREPGTSELLDEQGLWGDVSASDLWSSAQAEANVSILTELAATPPMRERELVGRSTDWALREYSVAELTRRAILRRMSPDAEVTIRPQLFRNWIRRYKLGLDDR